MKIAYKVNTPVKTEQFISLLHRSGLADRRPVSDTNCIAGMLEHSNLIVTAWQGKELVGIARSMTDYHYACYLSDLAVCRSTQTQGIGKQLQILTQQQLGQRCKLILIAAPAANDYYPAIGYEKNERCWVLDRNNSIEF